ncbi:MAG: hypothetical protein Q9160_005642 [Pyrenula sp. 1 TL-2023]
MGQGHLADHRAHERFEIYTSKHVQKSEAYATLTPAPGAFNLHTSIDRALHRHKRKVVGQAFTEQAIREFEPTIIDNVNIFIDEISKAPKLSSPASDWSVPLDMSLLCRYLSIDIMGSLGFGQSFSLLSSDKNRFIIQVMDAAGLLTGIYAQYPRIKYCGFGDLMDVLGGKMRARFGKLARDLTETRLSEGKKSKKDLFSFIIDAQDPENGQTFSLDELWAESRLMIVAGSDSVSTMMSATLFYLSRYPHCYEKLVSIIRSSFSSADDITKDNLSSCQYLRACMDETMRMTPTIATTLWREVLDPGITLDGSYIPPGIVVGCSLYTTHHNESAFPDSFTYDPDRWIESKYNPTSRIEAQREAFRPFLFGSRECVAKSMALAELSVTIARTLWHFDFRRPSGPLDAVGAGSVKGPKGRHRIKEFQMQEHITAKTEGPYLEFRRRSVASEKHVL